MLPRYCYCIGFANIVDFMGEDVRLSNIKSANRSKYKFKYLIETYDVTPIYVNTYIGSRYTPEDLESIETVHLNDLDLTPEHAPRSLIFEVDRFYRFML